MAATQYQTRHGESTLGKQSVTYRRWCSMIRRTSFREDYKDVTVHPEWRVYESFKRDMGECPSEKHTLDRKDNSKGYEPGNCQWSTAKKQANNRTSNVRITLENGREVTVGELCDIHQIPQSRRSTIYRRIGRGIKPEQAVI